MGAGSPEQRANWMNLDRTNLLSASIHLSLHWALGVKLYESKPYINSEQEPSMPETTTPEKSSRDNLIAIEVAISLVTVPALVALVGAKALTEAAHSLGQWSEELFRGDRLPLLNVPPSPPSDT